MDETAINTIADERVAEDSFYVKALELQHNFSENSRIWEQWGKPSETLKLKDIL